MSSDLQSAVQSQLYQNAISLAEVTIVACDYILMFPSEVKHIWSKSWTWVSVLYLIVRYAGIYSAMDQLFGTTFIPGPIKTCTGIFYSSNWAFTAFAAASSLLMVLRIYAMWNRSKVILSILLPCYTAGTIFELIYTSFFVNPDIEATVGTSQLLDYSYCTEVDVISSNMKYVYSGIIVFDGLLLILALVPLVKQSITAYKTTGHWEPNRYMSLIVEEGAVYVILVFLTRIPQSTINSLPYIWLLILEFFYYITMFLMGPRFVISMRELFDKDSRGRLEGIDSAFGISSSSGDAAGRDTSVSEIRFAGVSSHPGEEGGEEIQLEARGDSV